MKAQVVASTNGDVGIVASVEVLRGGGSALEAVLAGLRAVEANPDDHSVGYSGLPNMLGEVELDASVMVGAGRRAGSVAAVKNYQEAGDLAAVVMEHLPHVLIAGEGAARLAAESGFQSRNLLSPASEAVWKSRLSNDDEDPRYDRYMEKMREIVASVSSDPQLVEPPHGTVNFLCQDREGRLASGVSTSGWAWKYPGRVGDSPIIGAGNYCDDRYGAAACTGRGEMAQRALTAHSVVTNMKFGMSIEEAVADALLDLRTLDDPFASEMNIVALSAAGMPWAGSTAQKKTFIVMDEEMQTWDERPRAIVPLS